MNERSDPGRGAAPPPDPAGVDDLSNEEYVDEDDAVIGRAFRWSLVAIGAIAVAVLGVLALLREDQPEVVPEEVEQVAARTVEKVATPPVVRFTDVTAAAGIDFVHENGARGDKLLPETMGGGCAFFDLHSDGDADLLFVNSTLWPEDASDGERLATMALYANDGSGRFDDVTEGSGLDVAFYGMGAAVGDVDADGDEDLFLSAVGPNHFYRALGGRFEDATEAAGLAGGAEEWSASAAFFDLENDGDLDLFVCNYVRWSRAIDEQLDYRLTGVGRAYGPPTNFRGTHSYLYRNAGDGTFADVSAEAGIQIANPSTGEPAAKALGVAPVDIDHDGWIDLLVANDTVQNFLFHNLGDGTFEERGAPYGVGFDRNGNSTGAMGIDSAHYRNDEALGFAIGNFANEMSSLYVSQRRATQFADESIVEGIGAPTRGYLSFGLFFFDYDLDGRLDLLQVNGHLEDEINQVQPSQHYRQPPNLFWNAGPEHRTAFVEVDPATAGDFGAPIVGRGCAYADVDADGDLDVVLTQTGGAAVLLRNDQVLGHHWLRVRLEGRSANRDGIGAWIELEAGGVVQRRQVMPSRSYLSQVEPTATFGLGAVDAVDALRVVWPGGAVQEVEGVEVDTLVTVVQAD